MAATYVLISSQILGSSVNSVTFSSIPQTYTDLKLVCSVRTDDSTRNSGYFNVTFNGDTSTNYSLQSLLYNNGSVYNYAGGNQTNTFSAVGGIESSVSTSNTFSTLDMYIPSYSTTGAKQFFCHNVSELNLGISTYIHLEANSYRGTAAITSLNISANTANYITTSSFYLYGIKNS